MSAELALVRPALVGRVLLLLLAGVKWSTSLRLTHMKAPLVQDFREPMDLECHFDMGKEELYAVKWYKDDQEFFRFMPSQPKVDMTFPVPGVHLVAATSNCSLAHCRVRLEQLTREHSGGAYRCEISSEAPAFRLASETHNVTVAALPRHRPRIEGLTPFYVEGDIVQAKCVSDPADPTPILSWYINGLEAPSKNTGDMTSTRIDSSGLVSRSLNLRFQAERKHSRGNGDVELRCVSSLPGIPQPPQESTAKVAVRTASDARIGDNQKLHWFDAASVAAQFKTTWLMLVLGVVVRWSH